MKLDFKSAPTLETERLILREFRSEDFEDFAEMWADPVVVKHISGVVSTRNESWIRLMSHAGAWPINGFGYWIVIEKNSDRFVGIVGFGEMKRDITPSIEGQPEAGWVLAQWAHGRGFATEAMQGAMKWGLKQFGGVKPVAIMDPGYAPTRRVAQKCNFVDKELTVFKGDSCLIMEYQG
ncbi:MAG: GNAT family N-acetyltransferase [Devosiaceae bacterium]|nr:GNAT family N-acetyltransferase [Devosiaceae bacterium]